MLTIVGITVACDEDSCQALKGVAEATAQQRPCTLPGSVGNAHDGYRAALDAARHTCGAGRVWSATP